MRSIGFLAWALAGALIGACSAGAGDSSGDGEVEQGSAAGSGGSSGSSESTGDGALFDGGMTGSTGSGVDPDAACATSSVQAQLAPLTMFVMFDRSGSMQDDSKWDNATSALKAFFQDPGSGGLRAALRFFPGDGCDGDACDADVCAEPLVDAGKLAVDPAPADKQEAKLVGAIDANDPDGDGTPIYAALDGAERWAKDYIDGHPGEATIVVLVTDGDPNGCNEDIGDIAGLAEDARNDKGVLTYAVGLAGSNDGDMDEIAQKGGTTQAFQIGNGNAEADLLAALKKIQGSQIACKIPMPQGDASNPVDPSKVNVSVTLGMDPPATVGQVGSAAECSDAGGWYYDVPSMPSEIVLCPSTCSSIQGAQSAKLDVVLGCATQIAQ